MTIEEGEDASGAGKTRTGAVLSPQKENNRYLKI